MANLFLVFPLSSECKGKLYQCYHNEKEKNESKLQFKLNKNINNNDNNNKDNIYIIFYLAEKQNKRS